jgi:hypothetical protein
MSQRIISTINGIMLQDTVAGVIYSPFRPYLVENNGFIDNRVNKTEFRAKEIEILAEEKEIPKGLTDQKLEVAFKLFKTQKLAEGFTAKELDFKEFVENLSDYLPGKSKKPADEKTAADPKAK